MDEQFDNELKNRVSKVFENFEHPSVDKGWMRLQEKLPRLENNRGISWLWAAAAVAVFLLIFWGVNILVGHQENETKRLSHKTIKQYGHENKIEGQNKKGFHTFSSSSHAAVAKNSTADVPEPKTDSKLMAKNQALKIRPPKNQKPSPKDNNTLVVKAQSIKTGLAKPKTAKSNNAGFLSSLNKNKAVATGQNANATENIISVKNADTAKTINKEAIAVSLAANNDTVSSSQSLIAVQKPDTTLFIEKHSLTKAPKIVKKDKNKIEFGIYAATYFNYSKGISIRLNAGAGITADIRLFKNLKLSTGLAIAQNTLDYGNQLPNLSSVVNTGAQVAFDAQRQALAANPGVAYSLVLKDYTAQLLGLDVPLNLKYEFNSQKNDRYFSVGLSSSTFIHQSYTYQYIYSAQPVQITVTSTSFNSFYFAKTLNVALGLGYPVGKTNRLIVEPFLKYPLSGLGDEGIRFGASGINLKFDFQASKK